MKKRRVKTHDSRPIRVSSVYEGCVGCDFHQFSIERRNPKVATGCESMKKPSSDRIETFDARVAATRRGKSNYVRSAAFPTKHSRTPVYVSPFFHRIQWTALLLYFHEVVYSRAFYATLLHVPRLYGLIFKIRCKAQSRSSIFF